jgi:hypothetical protein
MSDKQEREYAVNRMTGKKENCAIDHDLCISIVLLIIHQQIHTYVCTALTHTVSFFFSYFCHVIHKTAGNIR